MQYEPQCVVKSLQQSTFTHCVQSNTVRFSQKPPDNSKIRRKIKLSFVQQVLNTAKQRRHTRLLDLIGRLTRDKDGRVKNLSVKKFLIPYLPVYNAHLFSLKLASKIEMRIIHGILCLDPRAIKHNKDTERCDISGL